MKTLLKAVKFDEYGETLRAHIGEFDREKNVLYTKKLMYFNSKTKEYIKETHVNLTETLKNPLIYRTDFKHEALKNHYMLEEKAWSTTSIHWKTY